MCERGQDASPPSVGTEESRVASEEEESGTEGEEGEKRERLHETELETRRRREVRVLLLDP